MRWVLSWSFWMPFATLSFSVYLYHAEVFAVFNKIYPEAFKAPWYDEWLKAGKKIHCESFGQHYSFWTMYGYHMYNAVVVGIITLVLSVFNFILIEKPSID